MYELKILLYFTVGSLGILGLIVYLCNNWDGFFFVRRHRMCKESWAKHKRAEKRLELAGLLLDDPFPTPSTKVASRAGMERLQSDMDNMSERMSRHIDNQKAGVDRFQARICDLERHLHKPKKRKRKS